MEHNRKPGTRLIRMRPTDSRPSRRSMLGLRTFTYQRPQSQECKSESSQGTEFIPIKWTGKFNTKNYYNINKGDSLFKKVKKKKRMLSYNKGRHCRKLSYLLFPGLGEDWIRKELKKLDGEPCRAEIQISEDGAWPPPCLLLWGQRKWMESPRPQWTARAAHLCGNTARVPVHSALCRSMQKQNDRRKKNTFLIQPCSKPPVSSTDKAYYQASWQRRNIIWVTKFQSHKAKQREVVNLQLEQGEEAPAESGRTYLPYASLSKDSYTEYIRNASKSVKQKDRQPNRNERRTCTGTLQNNISE